MSKLARGTSALWAFLYRAKFARAPMPFWRVVVEARLNRSVRKWPRRFESAVTAVFVWAPTSEEAEAIALLALEPEGLDGLTADAVRCPPAARPLRAPGAVARGGLRFLPRIERESGTAGPPRTGARA